MAGLSPITMDPKRPASDIDGLVADVACIQVV
jgi:hypothetical protein